jgi:hypothetical protein
MRVRTTFRLATPLLALILALGCADAGQSGSTDGVLPTLTEPGFYPLLSAQAPAQGQSAVTLSLKQVPGGIELASVQGEIEYDAATLQLARVSLPAGLEGDAVEVSPGRVRFVGTLVQGVAETPLLHLVFTGRDKPAVLAKEMFSVRFEEVTGGADLADLTSTIRSDQLLFVRNR